MDEEDRRAERKAGVGDEFDQARADARHVRLGTCSEPLCPLCLRFVEDFFHTASQVFIQIAMLESRGLRSPDLEVYVERLRYDNERARSILARVSASLT